MTEPRDNFGCFEVDLVHHLNLIVPLRDARLIDANLVDPQLPLDILPFGILHAFRRLANDSLEEVVKVTADQKKSAIDGHLPNIAL